MAIALLAFNSLPFMNLSPFLNLICKSLDNKFVDKEYIFFIQKSKTNE